MFRLLGLWRLAYGRATSDWAFLLAIWLLVLGATTLLTAGASYAETVELGGLRRALAEAPLEQRAVTARLSAAPAEVDQLDVALRPVLEQPFSPAGADVRLTIRSSTLSLLAGEDTAEAFAVLGAYEGLADHAQLTEGHWPEAGSQPLQAAMSAAAAGALGVGPADRLALADASRPGADPALAVVEVVISGIYEPDVEDPYWLADPLETQGVEQAGSTLLAGPLMVELDDLLGSSAFTRLDVRWRTLPRIEGMRLEQLERTQAALAGLPAAIERSLPADRFVTIERGLAQVLGQIDRSALVSRSGVLLVTLQFGILAAYAVLLAGQMLAERRRPQAALLRARGASGAELGLVALGEALLLSLPAVLVAPALALAIVEGIGGWGPVGESGIIAGVGISQLAIVAACLGGLGCLAALTIPALLAEIDLARVRAALGRPLAATAAQRLGLDLLLLVLAAIGILQLRAYGSPLAQTAGGRLEIDPLLVSAPAISLAAGAVLVVRLVPRLGEAGEWLLARGRGILLPTGSRHLARRPLHYTRIALLLVLSVMLATFGTVYAATWNQSQRDQAAYQVGGDVRLVSPQHSRLSTSQLRSELAGLPGLTGSTALVRGQLGVGRAVRDAELLAIEPESLLAMADLPAGSGPETTRLLEQLVEQRLPHPKIELGSSSRHLAIVIDADVQPTVDPSAAPPDERGHWSGIALVVDLESADGHRQQLGAGEAQLSGAGQRLVLELPAPTGNSAGWRLVAIEIEVGVPAASTGTISLRSLEVSDHAAAEAWQQLVEPAALNDWSIIHYLHGGQESVDLAGPAIRADADRPLVECYLQGFFACLEPIAEYRWAPHVGTTGLAAVVNEHFLREAGVIIGARLTASHLPPLELEIIGSVALFPTLDPQRPFVIVDSASLDRLRFDANTGPATPSEWWLSADTEQIPALAQTVLQAPIAARQASTREGLTRALQRDPVALGLVGALLLGSLAAVAFALVGVLVNAVVSVRERMGEIALLRALGLSRRQVLAWLSAEHVVLLGIGLLAGGGLGLLLGALVLPHAPLNRSGEPAVPEPQIVLPLDLLAPLALGALAVIAAAVLITRRQVEARQVPEVLREGDG